MENITIIYSQQSKTNWSC